MFFTSARFLLLLMALFWSVNASAYRPTPSDCAAEADRAARDSGSVMGGVVGGAAKGAVFGAIVGDSGKSTGRGAALGAVVGGARRSARQNDVYQRVYDNCMRGSRY